MQFNCLVVQASNRSTGYISMASREACVSSLGYEVECTTRIIRTFQVPDDPAEIKKVEQHLNKGRVPFYKGPAHKY